MSCSSTCDTTTSCGCSPYDNCGCLNPTTFGCVTYTGNNLFYLEIDRGTDGDFILSQIEDFATDYYQNKGKVLVDESDTCPDHLFDKLAEGLNIAFSITGTGCDRKLVINAVDGGTPVDVNVKASSSDTTSGYLNQKLDTGTYLTKDILNAGGDETLVLDVVPETLISSDSGNQLTLGSDGGLKTLYTAPDGSETKVVDGTGVTVSGSGTLADPYVISTNPSIQAVRSCFDATWRPITLVATGNINVAYVSGAPQYRYRFDGSIEFKGSLTYTVAFSAYSASGRKYTVTAGNIPVTCLNLTEQAGSVDMKGINYIDVPQASADQITQTYGYVIRKSAQNIVIDVQSAFTNATTKTIVINFDGCISHPSI